MEKNNNQTRYFLSVSLNSDIYDSLRTKIRRKLVLAEMLLYFFPIQKTDLILCFLALKLPVQK